MKQPIALTLLLLLPVYIGCNYNQQIRELYTDQARLRAEINRTDSKIQKLEQKTQEDITQINQNLEQINRNLKEIREKLYELEKSITSQQGYSSSPDELYSQAKTYYANGEFRKAILAFQRFIDMYPDDRRVPESYLKQGLSLIKLRRNKDAVFFFRTLMEKFPESEEAKIAREKLKEIEKES
ncbi:MAG: hypothetical protein KatS3mg078_2338 [Deltaproteobacteria bacterium]|jgi:tetratricopeptide (TPR) repeat protein|nr:MAG: hypothetical protein KatS3mg078_2338 [Deltaproteobacteria bacterium]